MFSNFESDELLSVCCRCLLFVVVYAGIAFTDIYPFFTDKYQALRIYTKPVRFCLQKNLV